MKSKGIRGVVVICSLFFLCGCKNVYYQAYEKVGVYKRDLLKKRVIAARDEEKEAQQEFKDALTRLKELTAFDGGELEKRYRQLQADYDDSAQRVAAVHKRIDEVESVARDLFSEWEKENKQIQTASLRATSQQQLRQTRRKYEEMLSSLRRAESSMDPVLRKFNDYVLALKHSLNAQAVASLKGESMNIQREISQLLEEMNTSIKRADEFIREMQ